MQLVILMIVVGRSGYDRDIREAKSKQIKDKDKYKDKYDNDNDKDKDKDNDKDVWQTWTISDGQKLFFLLRYT